MKTTLSRDFLDRLSKNFIRHGGDCFHFHAVGTACLNKDDHPDAVSFQIYRWDHPLARFEGVLMPYFLDERSMVDYFEYYNLTTDTWRVELDEARRG
jgi:hypothetical protein